MSSDKNPKVQSDSEHHEDLNVTADAAQIASQEDHQVSKWQAVKNQPLAFFWCIYAVWVCLLVSFENQASGSVISIPQFRKDFGSYYEGNYVIPAKWQSAFSGAPVAS